MGSSVRPRTPRLPKWSAPALPYGAPQEVAWSQWALSSFSNAYNQTIDTLEREAPGQIIILPFHLEQRIEDSGGGTTMSNRYYCLKHIPFDARVVAVTLGLTDATADPGVESDWVEVSVGWTRPGSGVVTKLFADLRLAKDATVAPDYRTVSESKDLAVQEVLRGDRFGLWIGDINATGVYVNTCAGVYVDVYLAQIGRFGTDRVAT